MNLGSLRALDGAMGGIASGDDEAIGLVAIAVGIGVMVGQMWARVLSIVIAVVSAPVNIVFMSAYRLWSTTIIAMDVLVI